MSDNNVIQLHQLKSIFKYLMDRSLRITIEINHTLFSCDYDFSPYANAEGIVIIDVKGVNLDDLKEDVVLMLMHDRLENKKVFIPTYAIICVYCPDLEMEKIPLSFTGEVITVSTGAGVERIHHSNEIPPKSISSNVIPFKRKQ